MVHHKQQFKDARLLTNWLLVMLKEQIPKMHSKAVFKGINILAINKLCRQGIPKVDTPQIEEPSPSFQLCSGVSNFEIVSSCGTQQGAGEKVITGD